MFAAQPNQTLNMDTGDQGHHVKEHHDLEVMNRLSLDRGYND